MGWNYLSPIQGLRAAVCVWGAGGSCNFTKPDQSCTVNAVVMIKSPSVPEHRSLKIEAICRACICIKLQSWEMQQFLTSACLQQWPVLGAKPCPPPLELPPTPSPPDQCPPESESPEDPSPLSVAALYMAPWI